MNTITMREKIAAQLGSISERVEFQVIESLTQREVDRLCNAISRGYDLLIRAEGDLKKVDKPDVENYNAEGQVQTSAFSKGRLEEIKKAKETVEKISKAIDKALDGKGDDLFKLTADKN